MTRIVASIVAVVGLAGAEVLTLAFTHVSEGYTILAAFGALIALITYLANGRPRALTAALLLGSVPPCLVVADAVAVPFRVAAPAVLLLLAAEAATMAGQRIAISPDATAAARSQSREIAQLCALAAAGALGVSLVGRVRVGSGVGLLAIGAGAVFGLLWVIAAEPGTPTTPLIDAPTGHEPTVGPGSQDRPPPHPPRP